MRSVCIPFITHGLRLAALFGLAASAGCSVLSPAIPPTRELDTPTRMAIPTLQTSTLTARSATPTSEPTFTPSPTVTATPEPSPTPTPVVLVGAGDIAVCGLKGAEQTAALLDTIPGEIFTAGDNSNESGEMAQYTSCFGSTWGRFLSRIHPSPGNHDYMTPGAADYYAYFGAEAGEPGKGYYSYDLGSWHIVALNSNCNDVGCGPQSEQVRWLQADLAAHPALCTLAYWHHPRFSSGLSGSFGMSAFWQVLYEQGADVVVNGNDHDYERFTPQDPSAQPDPVRGIREFVAGTGGAGQRVMLDAQPNSEVRNSGDFGVLKFTLYPDHYDWEFIPVAGASFTDQGTAACHE